MKCATFRYAVVVAIGFLALLGAPHDVEAVPIGGRRHMNTIKDPSGSHQHQLAPLDLRTTHGSSPNSSVPHNVTQVYTPASALLSKPCNSSTLLQFVGVLGDVISLEGGGVCLTAGVPVTIDDDDSGTQKPARHDFVSTPLTVACLNSQGGARWHATFADPSMYVAAAEYDRARGTLVATLAISGAVQEFVAYSVADGSVRWRISLDDVLKAAGLNADEVSSVFNYACPGDSEACHSGNVVGVVALTMVKDSDGRMVVVTSQGHGGTAKASSVIHMDAFAAPEVVGFVSYGMVVQSVPPDLLTQHVGYAGNLLTISLNNGTVLSDFSKTTVGADTVRQGGFRATVSSDGMVYVLAMVGRGLQALQLTPEYDLIDNYIFQSPAWGQQGDDDDTGAAPVSTAFLTLARGVLVVPLCTARDSNVACALYGLHTSGMTLAYSNKTMMVVSPDSAAVVPLAVNTFTGVMFTLFFEAVTSSSSNDDDGGTPQVLELMATDLLSGANLWSIPASPTAIAVIPAPSNSTPAVWVVSRNSTNQNSLDGQVLYLEQLTPCASSLLKFVVTVAVAARGGFVVLQCCVATFGGKPDGKVRSGFTRIQAFVDVFVMIILVGACVLAQQALLGEVRAGPPFHRRRSPCAWRQITSFRDSMADPDLLQNQLVPTAARDSPFNVSTQMCFCSDDGGHPGCDIQLCSQAPLKAPTCAATATSTGSCYASLYDFNCQCGYRSRVLPEHCSVSVNFTAPLTPQAGLEARIEKCRHSFELVYKLTWGLLIYHIVFGIFKSISRLVRCAGKPKCISRAWIGLRVFLTLASIGLLVFLFIELRTSGCAGVGGFLGSPPAGCVWNNAEELKRLELAVAAAVFTAFYVQGSKPVHWTAMIVSDKFDSTVMASWAAKARHAKAVSMQVYQKI